MSVKGLKNNVLYLITCGVLRLLGWLPVPLVLSWGSSLGRLAYWIAWPERRRAQANVQQADLARSSPPDRRKIVRDAFIQLGRSAMECVVLNARPTGSPGPAAGQRVRARLLPDALTALRGSLAPGRGAVFVTAHFGNWELLGATIAQVAPMYVLARQSYDPRFTRLIERFRAENGMQTIWVEAPGALRQAASALKRGSVVAVLLDQPVKRGGLSIPFLGRPATTSRVAASLARATGAALLVGFIRRVSAGDHRVTLEQLPLPLETPPSEIHPSEIRRRDLDRGVSETLTRRIEIAVREDPASWLWTLDRWRPPEARHDAMPPLGQVGA